MLVFSGSSHPKLAAALAKEFNVSLAGRAISNFPDKTLRIKINADVKDKTVVIVQTMTHPAHDHLIELLLLADAAKSAKAKKIIAVIPYLAYSKQDQVFLPGEPLSVRVIAQVLSHTSIDKIITLDLHHDHIAKFFSVPIHNLSLLPTFARHCLPASCFAARRWRTDESRKAGRDDLQSMVIVAPDHGAVPRAKLVADQLRLPLIVIDKHRNLTTGKVKIRSLSRFSLNFASFANCLVVDDLIVTGDTLVAAAKFLKSRGAKQISVFATHGLFTSGYKKLRSAGINQITVSDSIPHKNLPSWIKTISIASHLATAVKTVSKDKIPPYRLE